MHNSGADDVRLAILVRLALEEDCPSGDVTSESVLPPDLFGRGRFVARGPAVLAGTAAAAAVFAAVDPGLRLRFRREPGAALAPGEVFGEAEGSARSLLRAERTALNLLQRLSGIATLTRRFVDAVAGTGARVVDTRKTTPGLRRAEKDAVRAGGGASHRFSLSDGVLVKTNHARLAGGVGAAVRSARDGVHHLLKIEVEVRNVDELLLAIGAGADVCLLDNMTPEAVRAAVAAAAGRCRLEASGGIRLDNVRAFAETGVDLISIGALTHSAPAADLAFEVGVDVPGSHEGGTPA